MSKPRLSRKRAAALRQRLSPPSRYDSIERETGSSSQSIAHHESAHTLMASYVGLPWERVVMLPLPRLIWAQSELWYERPCSRALVCMAGPLADTLYERAHPELGAIHPVGSFEDLVAAQSCALEALNLVAKNSGEGLQRIELTAAQSDQVHFWMAGLKLLALEWVDATTPYRTEVARLLHERGEVRPQDLDCPPPGLSEEQIFSAVCRRIVLLQSMPPPERPKGEAPHLVRAEQLLAAVTNEWKPRT